MASKVAAKVASHVVPINKKATLQSAGIWEFIRRRLAIDPERSNGVPLNPYFRHPAPGENDPSAYEDPVTVPAGDIADNPYWKRDARRNYPIPSVLKQHEVVALLRVGSKAAPSQELIGDAGVKAIVAVEASGKEVGLAKHLEATRGEAGKAILAQCGGLPPLPSGQSLASGQWDVHRYMLNMEQSYPEKYPCRSFV